MSKGPYPFKESDIKRAIRAAQKVGREAIIEIDLGDGRCMRITSVKPNINEQTAQTDWDAEIKKLST